MEKKRHQRIATEAISTTATIAKKRKLVADVPNALFEETEKATQELKTTTSDVVRKALEQYLLTRKQKLLEQELLAGYLANATLARKIHDEWSPVDADLA